MAGSYSVVWMNDHELFKKLKKKKNINKNMNIKILQTQTTGDEHHKLCMPAFKRTDHAEV